jgi:hypothetical protein
VGGIEAVGGGGCYSGMGPRGLEVILDTLREAVEVAPYKIPVRNLLREGSIAPFTQEEWLLHVLQLEAAVSPFQGDVAQGGQLAGRGLALQIFKESAEYGMLRFPL